MEAVVVKGTVVASGMLGGIVEVGAVEVSMVLPPVGVMEAGVAFSPAGGLDKGGVLVIFVLEVRVW